MATYYGENAKASWQGNYFAREASSNGPTEIVSTINIPIGQAVIGNIFNFIKLSADTVILSGSIQTDGIDVHAAATSTIDLGFLSDANGDGETDVIDYWVDGLEVENLGAAFGAPLANDHLTLGPFVPVSTLTSTGANSGGYFVSAKLVAAIATAAAGQITLRLVIADKNGTSVSAE